MNTKLHINIVQGVIDVDGDTALVREIYSDFRDQLLKGGLTPATLQNGGEDLPQGQNGSQAPKAKTKRRLAAKKQVIRDENGTSIDPDAPKLDKQLDTAGLVAFYSQFEPKNLPEKILIFLKFLADELGIESPNTDQFYTCFEKVDERIPKAFSQAFRDAGGRKFGYIDYNSSTDIRLTTKGTNHFKFDLKRKQGD